MNNMPNISDLYVGVFSDQFEQILFENLNVSKYYYFEGCDDHTPEGNQCGIVKILRIVNDGVDDANFGVEYQFIALFIADPLEYWDNPYLNWDLTITDDYPWFVPKNLINSDNGNYRHFFA